MLQDYKLGIRMLRKYPGLTLAGGLALAIAIAIGAGWYDVVGKVVAPTIPLPQGDRLILIETQNALTNRPELRVARDFLEWRRELRTVEDLGAYRTDIRKLALANAAPEPITVAELTAGAFGTARVPPLLGRALLDADEMPGAPDVLVLGYDVWQRSFGGRPDVVGSIVKVGNTPTTVIGVMPEGFAYPLNHDAWMPLSLRPSYGALEGGAIAVIGRLAPGVSREQANAELRLVGERTAAALPATHAHLRPRVVSLAGVLDGQEIAALAMRNLPVLLVLAIACLSVGTLVYARTATREGEIAIRSALGASRARIIGQLFVEALVLASLATVVGLAAADRAVSWGIESAGDAPFWMTPGLKLSTMLYAGGLALVSAAMLSLLPALRATRARVQPHLARLGSGGATLGFGRVWKTAMIVQVALTAIGIPGALEIASETLRKLHVRAQFPGREYLAARIDMDRPFEEETTAAFQDHRALTFAALARRLEQEPGVVAVTFAGHVPGSGAVSRSGAVALSAGAEPVFDDGFQVLEVSPGYFEALDRPMVAGRAFNSGDSRPAARTVIVNEAFARAFARKAGRGSPLGAHLRYFPSTAEFDDTADWARSVREADTPFQIVGVVRDVGLDPGDNGDELPYVFHAAAPGTMSPVVMSVRMRGNPAALVARLPAAAAAVDARLLVRDARPLDAWIRDSDVSLAVTAGAVAGVTLLVLFLSAMAIFSLMSVSVSRRTREIGLRAALGANPRHLVTGVLSRAVVLMGTGIGAGAALLLLAIALGQGPSGRPAEDVPLFAGYLAMTSAVMFGACLLACIAPAGRALRINPTDALRDA
jgi:putative ABC transport system permease protein